jgi:thiol:disulfide interchange protein
LALYKKYHDKGLEVVCVASDDNRPVCWYKAVKEDGLEMFHHLLSGRNVAIDGSFDTVNDRSYKYNVKYLPTKFLIDSEGKIVGNLRRRNWIKS